MAGSGCLHSRNIGKKEGKEGKEVLVLTALQKFLCSSE